jgi:hypothetical protein
MRVSGVAMLNATEDEFSAPAAGIQEFALGIVNPTTGLANDYLNVFNEILLLLEFLPTMPEMTEEALAWQPKTYLEYFEQSTLPDARHALDAYAHVDPALRRKFESVLSRLTQIVIDAQRTVAAESTRPDYPDSIVESCEATAEQIRIGLSYVNRLVNEGGPSSAGAARSRNKRS